MSPKRKSKASPEKAKKQRKTIDLERKMMIIKDYEGGKKIHEIAHDLQLAHSTISTILKDKDRVKEAVKASTGFNAIITRQRKGLIHDMEKLLAIWYDDQIQKRMPLSLSIIQAQALSIFETLQARSGEVSTEAFTASNGWFQRFSRRFNLHNRSVSGEAASADVEAAEKCVDQFGKIIEQDGYCSEQIFNVDETGLFGKKMPEREGELTTEDLIELEAQQNLAEEEENENMEEVPKKFTVKGLTGVFSKVNAAMLELESMDPNVERFTKVERQISKVLQCYREIYEEKMKMTKQTTLSRYFWEVTPSSTNASISTPSCPLPGPSAAPDNSSDDTDENFERFSD